jgi:membrane-bound inhibitor of C-type lysozyme
MRRLRNACTIVSTLALIAAAGCTQEAEAPPTAPVEPVPAPLAPVAAPISYACESGQSVTVGYPDTSTAQLTYKGQTYVLRTVQAASGARFTGSGMEWQTVTADGQESATLSRLGPNQDVGVAVLERCSRPSSAPVAPGPVPPAEAVVGGPLPPAALPCKGPQLKLSADGGDAGMGHRATIVGVQNIGAQACSLTGYPTVTLQDARGRNLTTVRSEQNPGSYLRAGQAPAPVTLQPQAKAFFDVAWTVVPNEAQGETACPTAARIRAVAPGDTSPATLAQTFAPCGGRIQISPFRAVAEPAPTPAA